MTTTLTELEPLPLNGRGEFVPPVTRDTLLPAAWPIYGLFIGIYVWWMLGLSGFIQALIAIPILFALVARGGRIQVPRRFWIWLLFLAWTIPCAMQIRDFAKWFSYGWRGSVYLASTILFLWLFNTPRERLPASTVVKAMAIFWVLVVLGGVIGSLLPNMSFTTPAEILLPKAITQNDLVKVMVHPSTSSDRAFTGTGIYRPKVPFFFTNMWGSVFALTLPFAIAALSVVRSVLWRRLLMVMLVFSIVPLVFSFDRGAWLSAGAGVAYGVFRMLRGPRARAARILIVGLAVVAAIVLISPLGDLIIFRLQHGYGDEKRQLLYATSVQSVLQSPIFGYGSTIPLPGRPNSPSVGTHGQLWLVSISYGIPGAALFFGWLVYAFFRTWRYPPPLSDRDGTSRFWAHVVIGVILVQAPYYEWIPWGLPIAMIAAALAWREVLVDPPRPWSRGRLARVEAVPS
jgi:hypothetical protein